MIESNSTYFKTISILIDLLLVNLAGYLGYVRVYGVFGIADGQGINFLHILLINFVWFNVTQITKLYQDMFIKDAIPTIKQSLWSLFFFGIIIFLLVSYLKDFSVSNRLLVYTGIIFMPLFLLGKVVFLLLRRSSRAKLINYKEVVIVGAGPLGLDLKNYLTKNPHLGYKVVGFFDDAPVKLDERYILGNVDECIEYVKNSNVKEIYCALPDRALKKIDILMRQADKAMIRFKLVPDVKDYFKKNVMVQLYGHLPVLSPRTEPLEIFSNQIIKRIFDVLISLMIVIFIMSWLVPVMAILIKIESDGPVFFKQLRSGKDNHSFFCLKFSIMFCNL
jgi:putative colanic acid biosynthesis UDP-glucose lipid carrier transferase